MTWHKKIIANEKKYPTEHPKYSCEDCNSDWHAFVHPFSYQYEITKDTTRIFLESVAYYKDECYRLLCSPWLRVVESNKNISSLFKKEVDIEHFKGHQDLSTINLYLNKLEKKTGDILLYGKVDGKYPIFMNLSVNKNIVTGSYFYTSKNQLLKLNGERTGKTIKLTESLNGSVTGYFEISYRNSLDHYSIKSCRWFSPDKKKSYEVNITDSDIY